MNKAQEQKYFRRWSAVLRANNWRMRDCRLVPEAVRDAGEHHVAVWTIAQRLADAECRAIIPDDLRKACHVHATGLPMKHLRMNDQQFDRLLLLWGDERKLPGLLIEPDHIASVMAWIDPSEAARRNTVEYLRHLAPDEVIAAIASDDGLGDDWESLPREKLQELGRILRARGAHRKPTQREPEVDPANVPF